MMKMTWRTIGALCVLLLCSTVLHGQTRVLMGYINTIEGDINPAALHATAEGDYTIPVYATRIGGAHYTGDTITITDDLEWVNPYIGWGANIHTTNPTTGVSWSMQYGAIYKTDGTMTAPDFGDVNNKRMLHLDCVGGKSFHTSYFQDLVAVSYKMINRNPEEVELTFYITTDTNNVLRDSVVSPVAKEGLEYTISSVTRGRSALKVHGRRTNGSATNPYADFDDFVFRVLERDYMYVDYSRTMAYSPAESATIQLSEDEDAEPAETIAVGRLPYEYTLPALPEGAKKWRAVVSGGMYNADGSAATSARLLFRAGEKFLVSRSVRFEPVYGSSCNHCFVVTF